MRRCSLRTSTGTTSTARSSASRQFDPGAFVTLTLADGTTRTYEVVERQQYGKLMLPTERIWTHTGPETLVLITCGGSFNAQIRHYRDNIVVYAVPVAAS